MLWTVEVGETTGEKGSTWHSYRVIADTMPEAIEKAEAKAFEDEPNLSAPDEKITLQAIEARLIDTKNPI